MSPFWFTLGWPMALWGLLLLPVLFVAVFKSRAVLSRPLLLLVTALRILVVILIVLAVADARLNWPNDELAVATIIDSSASVSREERGALIARSQWLVKHHTDIAWLDLADDPNAEGAQATDVGQRVSAALALLPRERVRRIVIATDGREDHASLLPAVRTAADSGVKVYTVPMGDSPPIDQVSVTSVNVPRLIRSGETANVQVRIYSLVAQQVSLKIELDGQMVHEVDISIPAGTSTHSQQVMFQEEGVRELSVQVVAGQDTLPTNNDWRALVYIASPPRVLVVRQPPALPGTPLAKVLQNSRLRVDVVDPSKVAQRAEDLNRYQLVVMDEASPDLLQEPQMRAVRTWVEDGGGLITITGVNAVRSQPAIFREIEPIIPPRAIPETPPLELILVIDRSGSMSGRSLAMARQAGVAAVQALRPDSRVGLVAFSGSPDTVIAPVDMSQSQFIIGIISSLTSGGGTDIASALNAAGSIMTNDPRYLHHIVLLSDGISSQGPAIAEAQALAWRGITISTISLGSRNSLMSDVARIGQGRYHVATDASQLPNLFVREARYRQAPPHKEVDFRPEVAEDMAFLDGVDFGPDGPIGGYVLAETRPEARTVLRSPDGDPILAHWEVGAGQVASFTSTTSGQWSNRWRPGASFERLWSQMAWEMLRERIEGELEMRVDAVPGDDAHQIVTVASRDLEAESPPFVSLSRGPSADKPIDLVQRGPGLWQAEVDLGEGFVATGHLQEGDEPVAAVAVDNPYPLELSVFGADQSALSLIAETGDGMLLEGLEQVLTPGGEVPTMQRLRLPLLLIALVLYLLSVLLLRLPQNARATAARLMKRKKKPPPPAAPAPQSDHVPEKKAA